MFSYLRYFSIISFVVVVVAAGALGVYFRSIASGDLADVAEKSSISLAQGFINTTWKKHLPNIKRLSQLDASEWGRYREFVAFSEDTFRHFEGVPVTQLNIYTASGELVLSVAQDAEIQYVSEKSISTLPAEDETRIGFNAAKQGNPYSRIIEDSNFKSPSGEEVQGAVVQTFVPILPDSYSPVLAGANVKIDGVIEVFYDITPQWEQLYLFQMIGTGGILIIFVTLIGALFFTSKKAEAIITTQHEANVELAATAAKAEAESRQKSQFLANVSHELRTPLNAIIGFSEIIKNEVMGALGNETYMNYIKDIHSSGVHLLSLINDILDFSKAEAGKLELQLSELDATKLIKNCMRLVSPRAEQAKVTLTTEVPNEHFILTGDAKKLKQVLLNLLSNAVKFTPEEGEVKISAWQNIMDDSIAIEVKDSGIGIAPKDISRAMSPFGQVDSALSRKYEGTGLGLPLTKKFVEIMGGTFKIESEVNVGTTITITVPLTPPRHVLKASAKAQAEDQQAETTPREKQVSPQIAAHAAQQAAPAANQPNDMETLGLTGMEKPTLLRQKSQDELAAAAQTAPMPGLDASSIPQPQPPVETPLQPTPSLTAGKMMPTAPEPASEIPAPEMPVPEQPAPEMPAAPPTEPVPAPAPEAPAAIPPAPPLAESAQNVPPPMPQTPQPDAMPPQQASPPPVPPAASPAAPPTDMPAPPAAGEEAPSAEAEPQPDATRTTGTTPPSGASNHKFASYAEMKKMMQQQGGGNQE